MDFNVEKFKDKKIVVTGGAGFIGSHIVDALLKMGAKVICIDNLYNGLLSNINQHLNNPNFTFFQADVRDSSFLIEKFKDIDIVYHEGAFISVHQSTQMPEFCNDVNTNGTLNILNAARINDIEQVIFASSAALYADDLELPKHEKMMLFPKTPYGVSKLAGEKYMQAYYQTYGLKTTSLRYFNVYGIRQRNTSYAGVMALFIENLLKSALQPIIFGDGTQTRDFIFIKDIVKANLMVAYHPKAAGEVFNVATGNPIDIKTLTELILKATNNEQIGYSFGPKRLGDILHSYADISKIKNLVGFEPNYTVRDGIYEYISDLKH